VWPSLVVANRGVAATLPAQYVAERRKSRRVRPLRISLLTLPRWNPLGAASPFDVACEGRVSRLLEASSASAEEQEDDDDRQKNAEATATVVPDAGAHVVATTTEEENKNDKNNYQGHARECSTKARIIILTDTAGLEAAKPAAMIFRGMS
jgi:hypothetical protein